MQGMTSARRHELPPWAARLVAIPPVLIALISVLAVLGSDDPFPVVLVAVTVAVLPWLVRTAGIELPAWLFAAWVIVPIAALNLLGESVGVDLSDQGHTQFSLMLSIWLVGEMAAVGRRSEVAATTVATLAIIGGRAIVEPAFGHSWIFWIGGAGIALTTGFLLRVQQRTLSELRQAQAALAEEATQRERQRIAREVHDVIAHTMTVTLMHLQAARRALTEDRDGARETLEEAEALTRRSLADIRRTVGLLRAEGDTPETRALPDAGDIPTLVDSYRAAGIVINDDVDIELGALGPAASVTLYRLVQEALANAASHAETATVDLRVHADDDQVVLEVVNPVSSEVPTSEGGGLGLVGMRERVRHLGGEMTAGLAAGRWRVEARFPTHTVDVQDGATL